MPHKSSLEVEIKLRLEGSVLTAKRLLRRLGFEVVKPRVFEENELFDTPGQDLRNSRQLLRVRRVGKIGVLTYKGVPQAGKHKSREELEVDVSDPEQLQRILSRLGFAKGFRYEKFRTEFKQPRKSGIVTLDETPIGNYFELEGNPAWIDRTAKNMGFLEEDYITLSYGRLFQIYCSEKNKKPGDMVFLKNA